MWLLTRVLAVLLLLLIPAIPAAAEPGEPFLDDLKWIDRSADRSAHLTRMPTECVAQASDSRAPLVAIGRIAFRSPVLLGGIAARSGMSCNTCHRNGHGNPAFFLAGVSGNAGTADVTGRVFSTNRDDGEFNPVAIPSLVDVASRQSFGSIAPVRKLRDFVRVVIIEEFQGPPPSTAVTEGLLAYLTGLRGSACPEQSHRDVVLDDEALDLDAAYDGVVWAIERNDPETADFVLLSLRALLGRMHQRFPSGERARDGLVAVSTGLSTVRTMLGVRPLEATQALASSRERLRHVIRELASSSSDSFYDAGVLERALLDAQ